MTLAQLDYKSPWHTPIEASNEIIKNYDIDEECAIQRALDNARKEGKSASSIMMVCNCKKCKPYTL